MFRPKDAGGHLLPEISTRLLPAAASADRRCRPTTSACVFPTFRTTACAFVKPAGLRSARRYELLRATHRRAPKGGRRACPISIQLSSPGRIPNGKADVNNNGAFSTDYIGGSWDYPDAGYATPRAQIWQEHTNYEQGFFYFLSLTIRKYPQRCGREMNRWGLCQDEFIDNDNWPLPTLHPRGAPHGGRIRHGAEGPANRTAASPTRSAWVPTTAIPTTSSAS